MKKAWRVRVRVLTVHHERGGECPGRVCSDRLPLPMGHVRSLQSPSPLLTLTRVPGPSSAPDPRSAAAALGFRPKHVTQDMVRPARPRDHRSPPPGRPDPHHVPRHPVVRTPAPARTRRLTAPPETTSASTSCAPAASSSPRTRFSSAGSSSRYVPPLFLDPVSALAAPAGLLYALPPPRRPRQRPTPIAPDARLLRDH
jgi:hypothetical protein